MQLSYKYAKTKNVEKIQKKIQIKVIRLIATVTTRFTVFVYVFSFLPFLYIFPEPYKCFVGFRNDHKYL